MRREELFRNGHSCTLGNFLRALLREADAFFNGYQSMTRQIIDGQSVSLSRMISENFEWLPFAFVDTIVHMLRHLYSKYQ